MQTTTQIKESFDKCQIKLDRINKILMQHPEMISKPYLLKDVTSVSVSDWTFRDALVAYVSEKRTLKKVLGHH